MSQLCAHQLFMECLCPLLAKMWVRSYAGESSIGSVQAGMSNVINASFYKMYSMFDIGELLLFGSFLWLQLVIVGPRVCLDGDLGPINMGSGAQQDQVQLSAYKDDGVHAGDSGQSTEVIYRDLAQDYDPGDKKPQQIRGMQNYVASVWFLCSGLLQNQGGATWWTPWKKISSL